MPVTWVCPPFCSSCWMLFPDVLPASCSRCCLGAVVALSRCHSCLETWLLSSFFSFSCKLYTSFIIAGLISCRVILFCNPEEDSFFIHNAPTQDKFTDLYLSLFHPCSEWCPHLNHPVQIHQAQQIYHIYAVIEPPSHSVHTKFSFSLSWGCVWFEHVNDADMLPKSLFWNSGHLAPL